MPYSRRSDRRGRRHISTGKNHLRGLIAGGSRAIGCLVDINHVASIEPLAASGCDFLIFDWEESEPDAKCLAGLVSTARRFDVTALVRLPADWSTWLAPALSSGVDGVFATQLEGAADVQRLLAAVRAFGRSEVAPFIGVVIERRTALKELQQIIRLPGVGAVLFGARDLAKSLGTDGHPANMADLAGQFLKMTSAERVPAGIAVGAVERPDIERLYPILIVRQSHLLSLGADFLRRRMSAEECRPSSR